MTPQQDQFLEAYCALTGQNPSEVIRALVGQFMLVSLLPPSWRQS